jgi:hypothetical protein
MDNVSVNKSMGFKKVWNVSFSVLTSRLSRFNLERVTSAPHYLLKYPREIDQTKGFH